jgi:hypothetical protein
MCFFAACTCQASTANRRTLVRKSCIADSSLAILIDLAPTCDRACDRIDVSWCKCLHKNVGVFDQSSRRKITCRIKHQKVRQFYRQLGGPAPRLPTTERVVVSQAFQPTIDVANGRRCHLRTSHHLTLPPSPRLASPHLTSPHLTFSKLAATFTSFAVTPTLKTST